MNNVGAKKTYRVWAKITSYAYLDVEAESESEAISIGEKTDGGEFIPTHDGDFEIMSNVQEVG